MRLGEVILDNERKKKGNQNEALIRQKLMELAFEFPNELTRALVATGVRIAKGLPGNVIHAITIKHIAKNSELREAVARMLLEMDEYLSANGQTWGLIGGALSAVGSVLSGIGRSQTASPDEQALMQQQQQMQQQLEQERARRRRTTWVIIGISAVVIIGLIMAFKASKKKAVAQQSPKLATT